MDGVAEESLRFSADEIARIENPGSDEQVYGNTDWFDLLFKDVAPTYTNNVSVSGGTDKLKFFASVGAYNQRVSLIKLLMISITSVPIWMQRLPII